jgi:hypothetical protein
MGTMNRRRPFSIFNHDELDQSGEHPLKTDELRKALRHIRRLTHRLEDVLTHRPLALIAVVGGGGFALGMMAGSRLARMLFAVGVGFAAARGAPLLARLRKPASP